MKITEFKAGTGRTVTITSKTLTGVELEISGLGTRTKLGLGDVETLREFFQADRDEELGRWRWPENPDYVVYRQGGATGHAVVCEPTGGRLMLELENAHKVRDNMFFQAAAAYFAAHPEKKPWHTPNHLEIWALAIQGCPREAYIYRRDFGHREAGFRPVDNEDRVRFAPTDPKIVDAHRIWPESKES